MTSFYRSDEGKASWLALIAAMSWLLGVVTWNALDRHYLSQRPFSDVRVVSAHRMGKDQREIIATYEKVGCTIKGMVGYGYAFGNYTALDYRARRGPNEEFERIEGRQTMDIIVDVNGIPTITWDYATVFDDPTATDVTDRSDYTYVPDTKPTITTSPYTQNASIISFLGGSGAKIDGALVESPNVPRYNIEAENPVVGATPEQGKSMVANAYTMLSFGGTGWRLLNDAYAQIVSCFQIFLLNGVYCQSGGYCSITNSATNFGLYA